MRFYLGMMLLDNSQFQFVCFLYLSLIGMYKILVIIAGIQQALAGLDLDSRRMILSLLWHI